MEVIQLGRNDLYQLIAISFFEEEDFDDADLSSLYADVPNFTGSTPFITPGELVGIFTR